ncbi:hypothetical protein [Campylobacter lari]|uniref:hypothetical protein n=1 Tax=Campylobacter lari TaxID=201 RepID=UPI0015F295D8|nr:hypothetical protein [Campylobacter lari]
MRSGEIDSEFCEQTAECLMRLVKYLLFKYFKSSMHSFIKIIEHQIRSIKNLIKMIE